VRSLREVDRLTVYGEKQKNGTRKRVGHVVDVLFHPSEARVVGFVVERPDILFLFRRKDLMFALDRTRILEDRLHVSGDKAWGSAAAKRLGISWDKTVIWVGMPVVTESGTKLGYVRDGLFHEEDGRLNGLGLSSGLTADVALGVRDIPATMVSGFRDDVIRVSDDALAIETDGGAAAAAGRGAAVAQAQTVKAAVATTKAAKTAAAYGKSAVNVAAKSKTAKKTMGLLKSIKDQIVEAAGPPDKEK
jgi:uncharacterized protein YrrD